MQTGPDPPPPTLLPGDELTGEVLGVHFADPATGFGVVELRGDAAVGGEALGARCSGPLSDLVEGQRVRLVGSWHDHPRYGPTFRAILYEQLTPTTVAGLRAFLASDRFDDVPAAERRRVLTVFGAAAGRVIEAEPDRLVAEAGVTPAAAESLHRAWRAGQALADLVRLLEPAAVPYDVVRAVHAHFGPAAADVVRDDPYAILEAERCRFAHADALARRLGVRPTDPRRLAAAARAVVAAGRRQDGHQYLDRSRCVRDAAALLGVDAAAAAAGLDAAVRAGALVAVEAAPDPDRRPVALVTTPAGLRSERELATDLRRVADAPPTLAHVDPVPTDDAGARGTVAADELTAGQRRAVGLAFQETLVVLTGGPGTGKTRTVHEVVRAAERAGATVALCAPTGRAAKRLEEMVGRPATTIHRLLEARPAAGGGFTFRHGRDDPLPHDLVVCDEVSMCDTRLAAALLAAIRDGAHLLLVGDPDQLPSVGPGDVLRDLVRSRSVPTVALTEVHRQAAGSRVVALARQVNAGEVGPLAGVDGDVVVAEEADRRALVPRVVEAVANRMPGYFGVTVAEIQVVAPMYRGPAGVDALNAGLKAALNPSRGPSVAGFDVGDRVMQTRNDADLDVWNGDIGTVVDTDRSRGSVRVGFPRGEVVLPKDRLRHLVPAWAVTVHKSQGGEWPVVVLVLDRSHRRMLWRNLAYTAITRAQRALVLVGQVEALRIAARHDVPRNRITALAWRLDAAPRAPRPEHGSAAAPART